MNLLHYSHVLTQTLKNVQIYALQLSKAFKDRAYIHIKKIKTSIGLYNCLQFVSLLQDQNESRVFRSGKCCCCCPIIQIKIDPSYNDSYPQVTDIKFAKRSNKQRAASSISYSLFMNALNRSFNRSLNIQSGL